MSNYLEFIIYLAFQATLIYENRRSINIEEIHNYRLAIVRNHLKYHNAFELIDSEELKNKFKSFYNENFNMNIDSEI